MKDEEAFNTIIENLETAGETWVYFLTQESMGRIPVNPLLRDGLVLNYFVGYDILVNKVISLLGINFSQFKVHYAIKGYEHFEFVDTVSVIKYLEENKEEVLKSIKHAQRLVNIVTGTTFDDVLNMFFSEVKLLSKNRENLIY